MAKLTLRRMRLNPFTRELAREVTVRSDQMIQPHFVVEGIQNREAVPGLFGVFRETGESLLKQVEADLEKGVTKVLLFGVPRKKGLAEFDFDFTSKQVSSLRRAFGKSLWIAVDDCLCSSTEHGQCGVVSSMGDYVENHQTVEALTRAASQYADAGADCIAPSDMMDGRIAAIREALDQNGHERVLLMSYAAKFHSRFYGPFRVAADSAPKGGTLLQDRSTYLIDPARPKDAYLCALRDWNEGADLLMVKPGLPYLDVLARLSTQIDAPWAVYQVSGECASIELLAREGLVERSGAYVETWTAFARAGASAIITYAARYAKEWLR